MATVPVIGWIRFLLRPVRNAWTNRNATGIKPIEIIVLAKGAVVIVIALSGLEGLGV